MHSMMNHAFSDKLYAMNNKEYFILKNYRRKIKTRVFKNKITSLSIYACVCGT